MKSSIFVCFFLTVAACASGLRLRDFRVRAGLMNFSLADATGWLVILAYTTPWTAEDSTQHSTTAHIEPTATTPDIPEQADSSLPPPQPCHLSHSFTDLDTLDSANVYAFLAGVGFVTGTFFGLVIGVLFAANKRGDAISNAGANEHVDSQHDLRGSNTSNTTVNEHDDNQAIALEKSGDDQASAANECSDGTMVTAATKHDDNKASAVDKSGDDDQASAANKGRDIQASAADKNGDDEKSAAGKSGDVKQASAANTSNTTDSQRGDNLSNIANSQRNSNISNTAANERSDNRGNSINMAGTTSHYSRIVYEDVPAFKSYDRRRKANSNRRRGN
ncbi:hypothetical protein GGF42_002385 [Coemansia sp. RSA 2424]|nr:hypothetical protein GGF42_002385 [Coemansia sp. RSA 2424]